MAGKLEFSFFFYLELLMSDIYSLVASLALLRLDVGDLEASSESNCD